VCREFNVAGKSALIKALRGSRAIYDHQLRLPPKSGSLSDLKAVLCDGGFGRVIIDVRILLHPLFRSTNLDEEILEVLQINAREHSGVPISWPDVESTVAFNSARIRHQCQQQEEWYRGIFSPTGMAQLQAVFQAMPKTIRKVSFEQLDYWRGNTEALQKHFLHQEFESYAHPMTATFMTRVLTEVFAKDVECTLVDLPRFDGFPDPMLLTGSGSEDSSFNKVKSFDARGFRFPTSTLGENGSVIDLWAARQLGNFLSCAQTLEYLTFHLDPPHPSTRHDAVWLNGIFASTHFPCLLCLSTSFAEFDVGLLMTFLTNHKTTLKAFQFAQFRLDSPDDLLSLVRHLRSMDWFSLEPLGLTADLEEVSTILDELQTLIEVDHGYGHGSISDIDNTDLDYGYIRTLDCTSSR